MGAAVMQVCIEEPACGGMRELRDNMKGEWDGSVERTYSMKDVKDLKMRPNLKT